jgi:acetolactate synthase-1/2/3 large subunit
VRSGYYHENDQLTALSTMTKHRVRIEDLAAIPGELGRAFTVMMHQRPGPAFVETAVDVLRAEWAEMPSSSPATVLVPTPPRPEDKKALVELVARWERPLILAGGGVITANAAPLVVQLAERLGAPVFHTAMGKGAIPGDHPMCAGIPWLRATSDLTDMGSFFSPLWAEADGLLAVGCRFSQMCTGGWTMPLPPMLAHIDIDGSELGRHYIPTLAIQADAQATLRALLADLPSEQRRPWAVPPSRVTSPLANLDLVSVLRRTLPRDAIIAADVTRLTYLMLTSFPVYEPRTFLHPAGFVAMGYGLPAALGAKAAFPEKTVVAIAGDGCFLMSGMELATAVEEKLPIIVVLVNDGSLSLIKSIQERRYEGRFLGVDLRNPDFQKLSAAFGVPHWQVETEASFERALQGAIQLGAPALIEVTL